MVSVADDKLFLTNASIGMLKNSDKSIKRSIGGVPADDSITTAMLQDECVSTAKLEDDCVAT